MKKNEKIKYLTHSTDQQPPWKRKKVFIINLLIFFSSILNSEEYFSNVCSWDLHNAKWFSDFKIFLLHLKLFSLFVDDLLSTKFSKKRTFNDTAQLINYRSRHCEVTDSKCTLPDLRRFY